MPPLTIDTGNTAFMLLCSSLVMLMTPGLAFFYGGLVGRRNVLGIMIQSYVSMGWTTVLWFVVGYSLCFSGGKGGIIGDLNFAFLSGVNLDTPSPLNNTIPLIVFIAYQMMFAIITPALITGAFANRVTFKDRKSTRLNSSHLGISYAVFCLKKKKNHTIAEQKANTSNLPPRRQEGEAGRNRRHVRSEADPPETLSRTH